MAYKAQTGFLDALRWGSNFVAARMTLYQNGQPTYFVLPVSTGSFTVDRNSEHRRIGELTLEILPTVPPQTIVVGGNTYTLPPLTPTALLAPFGNEVFIEISVVKQGQGGSGVPTAGANGWVPLGLYQIVTSSVADTGPNMVMTLKLADRSWAVARRKLKSPYTVPNGTNDLQTQITNLINTAWGSTPPWTYSITPSGYTVPAGTYNQGEDPWQACLDMAYSAGYELFFDVGGNVVGKPIPTPSTQPVVWNFFEGEVSATGTLQHAISQTPYTTPIDASVQMTSDNIPNDFYVAAVGPNNAQGSGVPIQANAADTSATSPTNINGPMGDIPSFLFDSLISSQAQAQAEANYLLAQSLLKIWTVSVSSPPNPLFDIDDVVTVTRPKLGLNNQKFVIDTITTSIKYADITTVTGRVIAP